MYSLVSDLGTESPTGGEQFNHCWWHKCVRHIRALYHRALLSSTARSDLMWISYDSRQVWSTSDQINLMIRIILNLNLIHVNLLSTDNTHKEQCVWLLLGCTRDVSCADGDGCRGDDTDIPQFNSFWCHCTTGCIQSCYLLRHIRVTDDSMLRRTLLQSRVKYTSICIAHIR